MIHFARSHSARNDRSISHGDRPQLHRSPAAFTLIELLIVVAIIAILAAIAVPNFLEAQVRAKVARVDADFRTYATAIESYTVDNNRAPLGYTEVGIEYPGLSQDARFAILHHLTTPIAYLSSLPRDPFSQKVQNRDEAWYYFFNTFYQGGSYQTANLSKIRARGFSWVLYSLGPARVEGTPWVEDMLLDYKNPTMLGNIYDPTNGTVSTGKIYRTNKGIMKDLN